MRATAVPLLLSLLWAGAVAAEPYGCATRSGKIRFSIASPPVCAVGEEPVTWERERPVVAAGRPRVLRPPTRELTVAAVLAALMLPRMAGR